MGRIVMGRSCWITMVALAATIIAREAAAEHRTAHYVIRSEAIDEAEAGRLLEQLYDRLAALFGGAPASPLVVEIYATQNAYREALVADRQRPEEGGGYFSYETRKAYLFAQPTEYFTRHLLLHEATHQFQWLRPGARVAATGGWYSEGLAEYFAMHRWDGTRLETGVVPAITLEDYPQHAQHDFSRTAGGLLDLVHGRAAASRPLAWAMVHYLAGENPRRLSAFVRATERFANPATAWKAVDGSLDSGDDARFRRWLAAHQQPWEVVWTQWQDCGATIEGHSSVMAMALLHKPCHRIEVSIRPSVLAASLAENGQPAAPPLRAGLVCGFGADGFYFLEATATRLRVLQRRDGAWHERLARPLTQPVWTLAATVEQNQVTLEAGGRHLTTIPATGRVGIAVDGCRASFEVRLQQSPDTPAAKKMPSANAPIGR